MTTSSTTDSNTTDSNTAISSTAGRAVTARPTATATSASTSASTRHATLDTSLGRLTLVRDRDGLTGVYFPGHWTRPDRSSFGPRVEGADAAGFDEVAGQLGEYLAGRRRRFELPLAAHGDPLARRVWALIAEIPYGATATYGQLAQRAGTAERPVTAREVGGLVGRNPLSVVVPCHRVVGANGALTGYAGGLARKRQLLELEGAIDVAPPALW